MVFTGPGGHASAPHLTGNPIRATAAFVQGLDAVTAGLAGDGPVVATVTEALAGNTVNVIPARGTLRGTLRTLGLPARDALHRRLRRAAGEAAAGAGLGHETTVTDGYPAVVNDADVVAAVTAAAARAGLAVTGMERPSMVIEDCSYFIHRWPGGMG